MKKMKVMSIILAFMMLIGSMSVFAAIGPYYGNADIERSPGTTAVSGTVTVTKNIFGLGGKIADDDVFYKITGVSADNNNGVAVTGNLKVSQVVFETSFMLPNDTATLTTYVSHYNTTSTGSNDARNSNFIQINTNGIVSRTNDSGTLTWILEQKNEYKIESNKWYNLSIVFPQNGDKVGDIYLNGKIVNTFERSNDKYKAIYGVRNLYIAAIDGESLYVDNLYGYRNVTDHSFNADESTPSLVTGGEGVTVENNVVTVPFGTTAQQLKDIITTTDGTDDVKRVYTNSEMTTEAQTNDLADGTTLVVAAKNGTDREMAYSYYTVQEAAPVDPDADVFKGNSAYDLKFGDNAAAKDVNTQNGLFGKKEDDSAYKIVGSSENQTIISLPRTLRDGSGTFARSKSGAIEFSFCLPEGSTGFVMTDCTGRTKAEGSDFGNVTELTVDSSGMYSADYCFYSNEIKTNTWYNFAVEIATDGTNKFKVYLNGEEVYVNNKNDINTWYGFRTFFININKNETLYLDNLSISESYDKARNAAPISEIASNTIVLRNGKLYGLNGVASENDISIDSGAVRLYDESWKETQSFEDAKIAVFATTNGRSIERTYSYYDVSVSNYIVDYNISDDSKLNAKLITTDENAALIVASYNSDEYINLEDIFVTAIDEDEDGVYVADDETLEYNNANTYRIFVWNSVDKLSPLTKATVVK